MNWLKTNDLIGDEYVDELADGVSVREMAVTYEGYFVAYEFSTDVASMYDPFDYLQALRKEIMNKIVECISMHNSVKTYAVLKVMYKKDTGMQDQVQYFIRNSNSGLVEFINDFGVDVNVDAMLNRISSKVDNDVGGPSGLVVDRVVSLDLYIGRYNQLEAGTYVPLPKEIRDKKAVVNVNNGESKDCFKWAVLAALYPQESNAQRVSKYKIYEDVLNFEGVEFPVKINKIHCFEKNNNVSINVYSYNEDYVVYPMLISKNKTLKIIDLLCIKREENLYHYCWIKNLSRLVSSQIRAHHSKVYLCRMCLVHFNSEEKLNSHSKDCDEVCKEHGHGRVVMPEKGSVTKFEENQYKEYVRYVVYADFEAILVGLKNKNKATINLDMRHIASAYCYIIIDTDTHNIYSYKSYVGKNTIEHFITTLKQETKKIRRRSKQPFLPVFMHNLRGYDSHHILKSLKPEWFKEVKVIPTNSQKMMSFTLGNYIRFVDSYQFWPSSLDKLAKSLTDDDKKVVKQRFYDKWDLVTKKMHYPYEYMNSMKRYEDKELPPMEKFYDSLNDKKIGIKEYSNCQEIWNRFGMKTMKDYTEVYASVDVCLLADYFEKFREMSRKTYGLDPAYYYTAPGLAYDAMLKVTGVELELITDEAMHMFFERSMRGGISIATCRYAKANNPYIDGYDVEKPTNYIMKYDVNNLYGGAMCTAMPYEGFEWEQDEKIGKWNEDISKFTEEIMGIEEEADNGYHVEVDMLYPEELHDDHNDLPLAPEQRVIGDDMLSPYCLRIKEKFKLQKDRVSKLISSFLPKYNYIVHYRYLQQLIRHGMKVVKVHRAVKYKQKAWLKKFIDMNTKKRMESEYDFEKDFFKLMNNATFGKTMENKRRRKVVKIEEERKASKLLAKSNVNSFIVLNKRMVQVELKNTVVLLNKPIYAGATILDESKRMFYSFLYEYIKPRYGLKAKFLYGDTDSYVIQIETKDVYKDMLEDRDKWYDTSNYPKDNPLYSSKNKKVPGYIKDETEGVPIEEFVGLKSKMYSVKCKEHGERKAKGVKNNVVKSFTHDMYVDVIKNEKTTKAVMRGINSYDHVLYTVSSEKCALSAFDNKRHILGDGAETLAYGHYKIDKKYKFEEL
jgi:hypothetical protein